MKPAGRAFALLFALVLSACGKTPAPADASPPAPSATTIHSAVAEMAQGISAGSGTVGNVKSEGATGPVLVLEENHAASVGQLHQALLLNRAYEKYGLRTVVLEGYGEGDVDAAAGRLREKVAARAGGTVEDVGAALVSEGEITAAEFVALVHPDVHVVRGAPGREGLVSGDSMDHAYSSLKFALALVALEHDAMTKEEARAFFATLRELRESADGGAQVVALLDGAIRRDPWASARDAVLFPADGSARTPSIEEEIEAVREVRGEMQELPPQLAALAKGFDSVEAFLKSRSAASDDLSAAARRVVATDGDRPIALVVGMGHTAKITAQLAAANVPYAVIRPAGMDGKGPGNLIAHFERKYDGRSVSYVFDQAMSSATGAIGQFHPAPTIEQQWLATKAQFYGEAETYAHRVLQGGRGHGGGGSDGPPPAGPAGPLSPGGDAPRLPLTFFHDEDREVIDEGGHPVVIVRASFAPSNGGRPQTVWVKLAEIDPDPLVVDAQSSRAERALKNAIASKSREALHELEGVEQIRISERVVMQISLERDKLVSAHLAM